MRNDLELPSRCVEEVYDTQRVAVGQAAAANGIIKAPLLLLQTDSRLSFIHNLQRDECVYESECSVERTGCTCRGKDCQ